jgi:predicted nucleic acid-binding protein
VGSLALQNGLFRRLLVGTGCHPTWLSHWDGLIVAAATLAQCETLCSEDMQHGQVIGTVKVVNPFK